MSSEFYDVRRRDHRSSGCYAGLDSGRGIKGREIDVFIPRCAEAKQFGRQHVHVQLTKRAAAAVSKRHEHRTRAAATS
ncbi:MAG TPA: hypothetical protein VKE96_24075 [Vicinamibacterales bacterium]|nr:hypothetical protein [Vicinamibacterales bacterium]